MREPFATNRRIFLKRVHELSPISKESFKGLIGLHKIQPYFLAAMRKQHIIVQEGDKYVWAVGEPNDAMADAVTALEEELVRLKKGATPMGKRQNPLSRYSDQSIINELKARGFEGSIYKKIIIEI